MRPIPLSTMILLLSLSSLSANPEKYTNLDQCKNLLARQGQQSANACVAQVFQHYDRILNVTYKKLLPLLEENQKKGVILAQRAWIQFRDKDCEFSGMKYEGGSLEPYEYGACRVMHTRQRIQALQKELEFYSQL